MNANPVLLKADIPPPTHDAVPFTVSTPWTRITLPIRAGDAKYLESQTTLIKGLYGFNVHVYSISADHAFQSGGHHAYYQKSQISCWGDVKYRRKRSFSFVMETRCWEDCKSTAERLGVTVEDLCRAGLYDRILKLEKFQASQKKSNAGGKA